MALHVLFVLLGAFSILSQTVVLREYLVVYGGNEIALGLFFSSWLAWIAAGAWVSGKLTTRLGPRALLLPALAAYCLTPLVQTAIVRSLRHLAGVGAMEPFPIDDLIWVTLISNMPLSFLTGALFTMGASLVTSNTTTAAVSRVYLLEAAGGFAGGVLATLLPAAGVGPVQLLLGASAAMSAGALAVSRNRSRAWSLVTGIMTAVFVLALVTPLGSVMEDWTTRARFASILPEAELIDSFDTPYRNVAFASLGDQDLVLYDGHIAQVIGSGPGPAEDAALMMCQSRGAHDVLVLGLTSVQLVSKLHEWGPASITVIEPDAMMTRRLRSILPGRERQVLDDVQIIEADPRQWLDSTDRSYDLVILRMPDPDTAQLNRLFTVQFYRQVAAHLEPGGVFSTRVTGSENWMGGEVERYGRSVHAALSEVFDDVIVTPGENAVFMASPREGVLTDDPRELISRHEALDGPTGRFEAERFHTIMDPERVEWINGIYAKEPAAHEREVLNTDARPVTFVDQLMVMGATLDSKVPSVVSAARSAGIWIALIPLLLVVTLRLRHQLLFPPPGGPGRSGAAVVMASAGFVSISLDIVLLHSFQNRLGTVFSDIGLMNAIFMAGLAAGAAISSRLVSSPRYRRVTVTVVMFTIALLCAGAGWLLVLPLSRIAFGGLFALCGATTGAAFPAAGSLHPSGTAKARETTTLAALLESSDHVGGALGGLLAGVILVPVLGIRDGCLVLSAVTVASLTLTVVDWPGRVPSRLMISARGHARRAAFPWHGISSVLAGVVICALCLGWIVRSRTDRPRVRFTDKEIAAVAGEALTKQVARPFAHNRIEASGESPEGILLSSMAVAPGIKGYGGPINLQLLVRADGSLERVRLIESTETPAYVEGIGEWLSLSFEGKQVGRDFVLKKSRDAPGDDHAVDVLTGATVTSRAVVQIVNASKNIAAGVLGVDVEGAPRDPVWPRYTDPSVLYMIAAFVLAVLMYLWVFPRANPWPRRAMLGLNLALGGFVFNTQLSMEHVVRLMRLDVPAVSNAELVVLMGGAAILAVAFGPLYCANICPFGAAQELLSLLGLGVRPSGRVERSMRYMRYVVLAAFVTGWMLTGSRPLAAADPLVHVFSGDMPSVILLLVVTVLAISLFSFRFWCRTFCPVGALLSLGGRIGGALGISPRKRYAMCDLGARSDRDGECLHCNRCLTASTLTPDKLQKKRVRFPVPTIDRWARIAVAAVVVMVMAAVLSSAPPVPASGTDSTGQPRDVDTEVIKNRIEQHRLSDEEALYWRKIEGESQASPIDGSTTDKPPVHP